jgi:hypothetical protein
MLNPYVFGIVAAILIAATAYDFYRASQNKNNSSGQHSEGGNPRSDKERLEPLRDWGERPK